LIKDNKHFLEFETSIEFDRFMDLSRDIKVALASTLEFKDALEDKKLPKLIDYNLVETN